MNNYQCSSHLNHSGFLFCDSCVSSLVKQRKAIIDFLYINSFPNFSETTLELMADGRIGLDKYQIGRNVYLAELIIKIRNLLKEIGEW